MTVAIVKIASGLILHLTAFGHFDDLLDMFLFSICLATVIVACFSK